MGFNQDILRPLRSKLKAKQFVCFDTETLGDTSEFYICGVKDKDGQLTFFNREAAIKHLLNPKIKGLRVCTNLAFDFDVVFSGLPIWYEFKKIMKGSDYVFCSLKKGHKTITFIDAFSFGSFSVKKQGEIIGKGKLGEPQAFGRKPINLEELEELLEYNATDCEVTYEFMKLIQEGINELGGELKTTIASSSMNTYRRRYMTGTYKKEETRFPGINKLIYEAYYGGRTEAFKRGTFKGIKIYDMNGLFSWSQLNDYPNPNTAHYKTQGNINMIRRFEGISRVNVTCPEMNRPFLPIHGKKLLFPWGTWTAAYTHLELRYALTIGYIINEVYETLYYTQVFTPFAEFINDTYKKRRAYQKKGNSLQVVMKLIANSLYGKWGQRRLNDVEFIPREKGMVYPKDFILGRDMVYKQTPKECNYAHVFPIFSVYTSAYARIKMFPYIRDEATIYTDTDSVFTTKEYKMGTKLGELKLEAHLKECLIIRPKLYKKTDFNGDIRIKAKGMMRMKPEGFDAILHGERYDYRKPSKLKSSIRKGIKTNTWQELSKTANLEDDKRKWKEPFDAEAQQDSEAWRASDNA